MIPGIFLDAPLFADRGQAGRELLAVLPERFDANAVVAGLARGGVVVAAEIAAVRGALLDVVAVCKVRHPRQPEYALGAVAAGGIAYVRSHDGLSDAAVTEAVLTAHTEADELDALLHAARAPVDYAGRPVVLVDDGLATGATMVAAARWARARRAREVVAAVPVAARQSIGALLDEVDLVYCPHVRSDLGAVGVWYADFRHVADEEVLALLGRAVNANAP